MSKIRGQNKWKIYNVVLLLLSLMGYGSSEVFWQNNCLGGACSVSFMEGVLSTLKNASIFLSLVFLVFLYFPQNYFKRYFKAWFWWLFIIAYSMVMATDPVGGSIISLDRSQAVNILGTIGLVLTAVFIYVFYRRQKSEEQ